jgi:hypothetical protein
MKRISQTSTKDPQHMPPGCCEYPISVKHADQLLDVAFKETWNNKFAEFSARNRIYCPAQECGEWIRVRQLNIKQT